MKTTSGSASSTPSLGFLLCCTAPQEPASLGPAWAQTEPDCTTPRTIPIVAAAATVQTQLRLPGSLWAGPLCHPFLACSSPEEPGREGQGRRGLWETPVSGMLTTVTHSLWRPLITLETQERESPGRDRTHRELAPSCKPPAPVALTLTQANTGKCRDTQF